MEELLQGWLASQQKLALPGLGTLQIDTTAAELDFISKRINPPVQEIVFADSIIKADKNFYQYLSNGLHVDETSAIVQFTDFVTDITNKLDADGAAKMKGIGEFYTGHDKKTSFLPYRFTFKSMNPLTAEKILRHKESFDVLQGDVANNSSNAAWEIEHASDEQTEERWWIAALILFAVGAITILYYFLT